MSGKSVGVVAMRIKVKAKVRVDTGKSVCTSEITTVEQLMNEAVHAYVNQHGTKKAKEDMKIILDRYKPEYEGYE